MKGVMTVNIEIDYNTMLQQEGLQSLLAFTGAQDTQDLVQIHMQSLTNDILEVVNKKPLVRASVEGQLVNEQILEGMTREDDESQSEEALVGEVIDVPDAYETLKSDLNEVSVNKGIPTVIRMNSVMMRIISQSTGVNAVSEVNGFPVELEAMEELYIIQYKDYKTGEIEQFSPSNGLKAV